MKKVDIGDGPWRVLMAAFTLMFLEGLVMCFAYSPKVEGIVLCVLSGVGVIAVGCKWQGALTTAVVGGWIVVAFVAYKLYDLRTNDTSDVAGWCVFVFSALCGSVVPCRCFGCLAC